MTYKNRNYNKYLDLMRAIFCTAVLLYHLGVLEGGYFAVCSFFVLSGYLTMQGLLKKRRPDLKKYYISRIRRIWVPLLITVLCTVAVVSSLNGIVWMTMKQEVLSVLGGYNNFWQIITNQDYFAAHSDSPFMHFWYTAILMQFSLFFPLLYAASRKISKDAPALILYVLTGLSLIAFLYDAKTAPVTTFYYSTFSRVFSLLFGAMFAMQAAREKEVMDEQKKDTKFAVYAAVLILSLGFFRPSDTSTGMAVGMIASTLLTCFAVSDSWNAKDRQTPYRSRLIRFLSDHSYEIYLVQYPVIYLFQFQNLLKPKTVPFIAAELVIILVLAMILHAAVSALQNRSVIGKVILAAVTALSLYGGYCWVTAKDYTEDMSMLEDELTANAEYIKQQQQQAQQIQEYEEPEVMEDAYASILEEIDAVIAKQEALGDKIYNLPITAVGDSVLLSASVKMYETFPNLYCDAAVSRTAWAAPRILYDLLDNGMMSDTVLFNLGANGTPPDEVMEEALNICGSREIFLVTVTNNSMVHANESLQYWTDTRNNIHIIDWNSAADGHPEYFVSDGLHLTGDGQQAYADTVYNTLYDFHMQKLKDQERALNNLYHAHDKFQLVP